MKDRIRSYENPYWNLTARYNLTERLREIQMA